MKRVLCVLSSMNAGGAETYLMKIYRSLDRTRYQMDFCINVFDKNYYEDEIAELGGRLYKIPSRTRDLKAHDNELFKIINEKKYKYVLSVSSSATSYFDLRIAKRAGAEVCAIRSSNSNIGMPLHKRIIQELLRITLNKYADVLIAPSDLSAICMFGKNYLKDKRFVYLCNALCVDDYIFTQEKRNKVRKEFCIPDNKIVVGHVGRFHSQKNHQFLLEVFNEMTDKNSLLMLVGTGELEQAIRDKVRKMNIEDRVLFTGVRSDVNELLSAMDVFVFPSLFEGMPNTVVEAEASSLPCVISDSITKDVNILGNVRFISLNDSPTLWAKAAMESLNEKRINTKVLFEEKGYGIKSSTELFVSCIFGE